MAGGFPALAVAADTGTRVAGIYDAAYLAQVMAALVAVDPALREAVAENELKRARR